MDGIGGHMKQEFCKFTVESLSASYMPFPRFLMEDCSILFDKAIALWDAGSIQHERIQHLCVVGKLCEAIRLYFTVEQAQKKLHRSRQCATRIFRELESSGLICRKKQGLGKPALITLNYPSNAKLIQPKDTVEILSG